MTTTKSIIQAGLAFIIVFSLLSCQNQNNKSEEKETATEVQQVKKPGMDLHSAVFMGNAKAIKENIDYGTDLNVRDAYGSTALNVACTFGKTEAAKLLIDAGADVNATNADGGTPLHTAAFFCRTEILEMLLNAGAEKNVKNQYDSTPLESVSAPWENVKPIYEQFAKDLGPLGLRLDLNRLENTRPEIAKLLQ